VRDGIWSAATFLWSESEAEVQIQTATMETNDRQQAQS
jgi:hypothetical protein